MNVFHYLPQLIIAYDSNDEAANLIHIKKAVEGKKYYCPCCGGLVKPKVLDEDEGLSYYCHTTDECLKEKQLHFFCENWLFEVGSKFYIDKELFEVVSVDIEKTLHTPFGDHKPDITVCTSSGEVIYFEMFFSNRKAGDDYFCKWEALGNAVVSIDMNEYVRKTDRSDILSFTYLYRNGVCYSKEYIKKDLYANTIAKTKRNLIEQNVSDCETRIRQLDLFWQAIINGKTKETILSIVSAMDYEDMLSCYSIIKKKQSISYLKNDVLNVINGKVMADVRESLDLPKDENVYFDLKHISGKAYEAGIRLNIKTKHIVYDDLYMKCNYQSFEDLQGYPKIVFSKNMFDKSEIDIPCGRLSELKNIYDSTLKFKDALIKYEDMLRFLEDMLSFLEEDIYKIRVKNNVYTVLRKTHGENYKIVFDDYYMEELDIVKLSFQIQYKMREIENKKFVNTVLQNADCCLKMSEITHNGAYKIDIYCEEYAVYNENPNIRFRVFAYAVCIYDDILQPNFTDFNRCFDKGKLAIRRFEDKYKIVLDLVERINNCKNGFWKADFSFGYNAEPRIVVDQLHIPMPDGCSTSVKALLNDGDLSDESKIISLLTKIMRCVLANMEQLGYRVMKVPND